MKIVTYGGGTNSTAMIIGMVKQGIIPAADVRPERHGHWVYHHDIHGISYFCSNCTCGVSDTGAENYCHYCGAKMDRIGG